MAIQLKHRQLHEVIGALAEAKIVNLDAPVRDLIEPIASALSRTGAGDELSLHVLCCNEYVLVTGLSQSNVLDVAPIAEAVRSALGQTSR